MILSLTPIVIAILLRTVQGQDPCDRANHKLVNEPERSTGYKLTSASIMGSDDVNDAGWYRFNSSVGTALIDFCPGMFEICNTRYPIWINGSIPPVVGDEVTVDGWVTNGALCNAERIRNIIIRNCGGFAVYYLKPPMGAFAAYCHGTAPVCTKPSTPGEVPCSEIYPQTYDTSPNISVVISGRDFDGGQIVPKTAIACHLSDIVPRDDVDRMYIYYVTWLVNGQTEAGLPGVSPGVDVKTALLTEDAFEPYLNSYISCMANVRYLHVNEKSPWMYSEEIFIPKQTLVLPTSIPTDGELRAIEVLLTLPVLCTIDSDPDLCRVNFTLDVAKTPLDRQDVCEETEAGAVEVLSLDSCQSTARRRLPSSPFDDILTWNVTSLPSNLYGGYVTSAVNNITSWVAIDAPSELWAGTESYLGQIFIQPGLYSRRSCIATSGIHIVSFDNWLLSQYSLGEFVLYKNEPSMIEVRYVSKPCDMAGSYAVPGACICAVMVADGEQVTVIDKCRRDQDVAWLTSLYPNRNFETRVYHPARSPLNTDAFRGFDNGVRFQHLLSNGGYVEVLLTQSSFASVQLHFSPFDPVSSSGICSSVSSQAHVQNDFLQWRINTSSESLFYGRVAAVSPTNNQARNLLCSCQRSGSSPCSFRQGETCSEKLALRPCSAGRCSVDTSTVTARPDTDYPIDFTLAYNHANGAWPAGNWTEADAALYCDLYLSSNNITMACADIPVFNTLYQALVQLCKEDIKDTADTYRVQEHVDILRLTCRNELRWNTTLWHYDFTNSKYLLSPSRMSQLCPGNGCSGHGMCLSSGTCLCDSGYVSADCSLHTGGDAQPEALYIKNNGLYDAATTNSSASLPMATVVGRGFIDNAYLSCQFTIESTAESYMQPAIFLSNDTVQCVLPNASPTLVLVAYNVSVINVDIGYATNSLTFVFFDSRCLNCSGSGSAACTAQNDVCFIANVCYGRGEVNPSDACYSCQPDVTHAAWTASDCGSLPDWAIALICIAAVGLTAGCAAGIIAAFSRYKALLEQRKEITATSEKSFERHNAITPSSVQVIDLSN